MLQLHDPLGRAPPAALQRPQGPRARAAGHDVPRPTFLLIQVNEYIHLGFTPESQAFGATFFTLTGFHGAHVFVGLTLLTFAYIRVKRAGDFSPSFSTPLNAASLYWHFVDVVWVLLFILVYLI